MAFSLARLHEKAVSHAKRLHGIVQGHKHVIGHLVSETVRTGEAVAGGAAAALVDHYMGKAGDALPEAMLGPVPVVLTGALVLKAGAFAMGTHDASPHLHEFANGVGAAGTYATLLRTLKAHAASK